MEQTDRSQRGGVGGLEGISQRTHVSISVAHDTNRVVKAGDGVGLGGGEGGEMGTSVIVSTIKN